MNRKSYSLALYESIVITAVDAANENLMKKFPAQFMLVECGEMELAYRKSRAAQFTMTVRGLSDMYSCHRLHIFKE